VAFDGSYWIRLSGGSAIHRLSVDLLCSIDLLPHLPYAPLRLTKSAKLFLLSPEIIALSCVLRSLDAPVNADILVHRGKTRAQLAGAADLG